jgi:hypothetical protein
MAGDLDMAIADYTKAIESGQSRGASTFRWSISCVVGSIISAYPPPRAAGSLTTDNAHFG